MQKKTEKLAQGRKPFPLIFKRFFLFVYEKKSGKRTAGFSCKKQNLKPATRALQMKSATFSTERKQDKAGEKKSKKRKPPMQATHPKSKLSNHATEPWKIDFFFQMCFYNYTSPKCSKIIKL